jgi:hypothetical protein
MQVSNLRGGQSVLPAAGVPIRTWEFGRYQQQGLRGRGEVFKSQVLARAILNRLLHHATAPNIKDESYQLREKKAVLLGRQFVPAAEESTTDTAI